MTTIITTHTHITMNTPPPWPPPTHTSPWPLLPPPTHVSPWTPYPNTHHHDHPTPTHITMTTLPPTRTHITMTTITTTHPHMIMTTPPPTHTHITTPPPTHTYHHDHPIPQHTSPCPPPSPTHTYHHDYPTPPTHTSPWPPPPQHTHHHDQPRPPTHQWPPTPTQHTHHHDHPHLLQAHMHTVPAHLLFNHACNIQVCNARFDHQEVSPLGHITILSTHAAHLTHTWYRCRPVQSSIHTCLFCLHFVWLHKLGTFHFQLPVQKSCATYFHFAHIRCGTKEERDY